MPEQSEYESRAASILKAELKRAGVTYGQLAERLQDMGIDEKEANIRNKLARGKFSAAFLIQCMEAIELREIRV